MPKEITIIGDVHGKFDAYAKICKGFTSTIQIGDFGVGFLNSRGKISPEPVLPGDHKFFPGNHDNRQKCKENPNCLGDYGVTPYGIFFVSGAWSIDHKARTLGINWWDDEELTMEQIYEAMQLYQQIKPDIVLTHDAPFSVSSKILEETPNPMFGPKNRRTRTGMFLETIFEIHKPKKWIFGHWHHSWVKEIDGCEFRCLNELKTYTLTV